MRQKDAAGIAKSVDPDQTAPLVWSGSALFAETYLSENLGSLWYWLDADLLTWCCNLLTWCDVVSYWLYVDLLLELVCVDGVFVNNKVLRQNYMDSFSLKSFYIVL